MKKLHALLIGINDYPNNSLYGCLNDIKNIENYLTNELADRYQAGISIVKLINAEATRESIIRAINQLSDSEDDSTVLIYYSGHGTQEETDGLFIDEPDGLLECLVCYEEAQGDTTNLLADKEIRYLLSNFKNNPHIVTLFDCCHSGDLSRDNGKNKEELERKIYSINPARPFEEFIFGEEIKKEELSTTTSAKVFGGIKNHIHIAACLPSESSTEKRLENPFDPSIRESQGVLTNYLIRFLLSTQSNINYKELSRWSKISFNRITQSKQTPNINVFGDGDLSKDDAWMGVAKFEERTFVNSRIYFNEKAGWYYDKGSLWGIEKGQSINIRKQGDEIIKAKIVKVEVNRSLVVVENGGQDLDVKKLDGYEAFNTENLSTYDKLKIYINKLSSEEEENKILQEVQDILSQKDVVELVDKHAANLYLNTFNESLYFSFAEEYYQYRPLAEQLDLLEKNINLQDFLDHQLPFFQKWFHLRTLRNPGNAYEEPPIKIEIQLEGDGNWKEVYDNDWFSILLPNERGYEGVFERGFNLKITRTKEGPQPIFVGAYVLWATLGIDNNLLPGVQELSKKGDSVQLFSEMNSEADQSYLGYVQLSEVFEFYNWKAEPASLKFIVANESFSMDDLKQTEISPPRMLGKRTGGKTRSRYRENRETWQVYSANLNIVNPSYNKITGLLKDNLEEIASEPLIAGFVEQLYFDQRSYQIGIKPSLKANRDQSATASTESFRATDDWKIKTLNKIFNATRRRRFLKRMLAKPDLEIVLAEGDSWFLLPDPRVSDTLSYISKKFNVRSLADAGDELTDYIKNGDLIEEAEILKPKIVLLSGGGNDVIGPEVANFLIPQENYYKRQEVGTYLKLEAFGQKIEKLKSDYEYLIENMLEKLEPYLDDYCIFIHGYDYIRTSLSKKEIKNGWANKYLIEAGVTDPHDRQRVVIYLVDSFNKMLENLAASPKYSGRVFYVDNRLSIADDEWYDEIHPTSDGYRKIADNFLRELRRVQMERRLRN